MKYKIILNKSSEQFTWEEWVAKKPEERLLLNVQNNGIRVELEDE